MFWMWCSTQNQSVLPFVGFLRRSIASFILCIWPEKNKMRTCSKILVLWKISWKKQTPTILEAGDRNTVTEKNKEFLSRIKEIEKDDKFIVRCTGFVDVEVLSDLFLRERLGRLHVHHRLDVVPPEVGLYSASPTVSSHVFGSPPKLLPRARVPNKTNTTCWGRDVKEKPQQN